MAISKTQKILRYVVYSVLGVAVLGLLSYLFVIRPVQIHRQKVDFDKAESRLDALAIQIESTIGKPDQTKKEKSCGYSSQEFGKGPRSCAVSIYILYRSKDQDQSNIYMSSTSELVGTVLYYYLGEHDSQGRLYPKNFVKYNGSGPSQEFSQIINKPLGNISCTVSYKYPVVPLFDKDFSGLQGENFEIGLVCSGSALKEFYPLSD